MSQMTHKKIYEERINKVITYLCQNIGTQFTLDELSSIACFSKFHFLRIFKAFTGETVGEFSSRIRIEKAAFFLIYNLSTPITEIALDCGFSSSQNFAKAFKLYYSLSPSEFRKKNQSVPLCSESNPGNIISNTGKDFENVYSYIDSVNKRSFHLTSDKTVVSNVSVSKYQEITLAYIRKNANYTPSIIASAFQELFHWAYPRGLIKSSTQILSLYWDNVAVTPMDKRRFDVCFQIEANTHVSHPVYKQTITGGRYAIYHAHIENYEFYHHWNRFLKYWFPTSGFVPDNRPCFERFYNPSNNYDKAPLIVDLCVPIKSI